MNTLKILKGEVSERNTLKTPSTGKLVNYSGYLLLGLLLLLWQILQHVITGSDPNIGYIDPNIWLLILLGLIFFLLVAGLCWWLLQKVWVLLGLPALSNMVSQFKTLSLCYQLGFYFASFTLLLLAAIGCLNAIC